MVGVLLTQNSTPIIGPVAKLLGLLMELIFNCLDKIGIPNIGLAIIIFTIVIYLCLMPLTVKQQKFSKLSAKMNPELQAIQAKYKNKKDNDSMMKMNEETKAVYAKYGTSPTGSCLQLLIQMPILFALYRVIDSIPAYVTKVKDAFFPLVDNIVLSINDKISYIDKTGETVNGTVMEFIQSLQASARFMKQDFADPNTLVDVLNKCSTADFHAISQVLPKYSESVNQTVQTVEKFNSFIGINIANSPYFIIKNAWSSASYGIVIIALLFPILAALTQWINVKLMPQATTGNDENNTMASSMKTMNMMMPIMSAVFCFQLPAGMGLYWIAGAIIRSIQQIIINKHLDKVDIEEEIKKNVEKMNKKGGKQSVTSQAINNYAKMNTKTVEDKKVSEQEKEESMKKATDYYNKGAKPGSIAAKANMVKQYNEKNNK